MEFLLNKSSEKINALDLKPFSKNLPFLPTKLYTYWMNIELTSNRAYKCCDRLTIGGTNFPKHKKIKWRKKSENDEKPTRKWTIVLTTRTFSSSYRAVTLSNRRWETGSCRLKQPLYILRFSQQPPPDASRRVTARPDAWSQQLILNHYALITNAANSDATINKNWRVIYQKVTYSP